MLTKKPLPKIGVDEFHWAVLQSDPPGGAPSYSTPESLPGVTEVGFNPNSQTGSFYADNTVYETAAQTGDLVLTVSLADVPNSVRAVWFGQDYADGMLSEGQINPPDIAVGFRRKLSDGSYKYYWHLKAKAAPSQESTTTQGSSINFQGDSITINCSTLVSTGKHRNIVEDNDPQLPIGVTPEVIADTFFTDPTWTPEVTA